jgi:aspartokinase
MEITASYWESRIKTYGFQKATDLSLVELTATVRGVESLGRAFCRMSDLGIEFHLVFSGLSAERFLKGYLLMGRERETLLTEFMGRRDSGAEGVRVHVISPVDLVFFHGPHFADRYGIMDASLQALASRGLHIMASVCSGSCVYIVVPQGKAEEAASALSEAFEVPKVVRPSNRGSHAVT